MSPHCNTKRPGLDARDHLWALLPVFVAFFALVVLVASADDHPAVDYYSDEATAAPTTQHSADPTVPSAADAMLRLSDPATEPVSTF